MVYWTFSLSEKAIKRTMIVSESLFLKRPTTTIACLRMHNTYMRSLRQPFCMDWFFNAVMFLEYSGTLAATAQ